MIKFGTSGWRAVIAEEFTFANVNKVTRAIAKYILEEKQQNQGVIVGYDTRFLSQQFAQSCAGVFAQQGIPVYLTLRDTPTPVIAFSILRKKSAGAVNITASHNPPEYNGIKFSPAYGGPASTEITRKIEENINSTLSQIAPQPAKISLFDPQQSYFQRIKQLVDFSAIRGARLKIGVDLLHGSGRGYLDYLLKQAGCRVEVLHDDLNPYFGGMPPEPARMQLKKLIGLVKKQRLHLGLALDGDADRFGIVDRNGEYIGANQVISLLTDHLLGTRPKQKYVARTMATTHMVDALAKLAGLETVETPVGFKYIGREIASGNCLIGGEESGGLSIAGHVPEKDGILACLLIAELVAVRKKSLTQILRELYQKVGPYMNSREDFHLSQPAQADFEHKIQSLTRQDSLAGTKIERFDGRDGYKFIFVDSSWMMLRPSGTEPVVRCYCEAKSKIRLKQLLRLGQGLVKNS